MLAQQRKNRNFSPAQQNYMKAKALYETVKEIEAECKTKVLQEHKFYVEEQEDRYNRLDHGRILKPNSDFLMSESDFDSYCKLCFDEYKKAGLDPEHYNAVVSWPYREALNKSENDLIDWGWSILRTLLKWNEVAQTLEDFRSKLGHNLKVRQQVVDLTMKIGKGR